jgi:hypothetical protein
MAENREGDKFSRMCKRLPVEFSGGMILVLLEPQNCKVHRVSATFQLVIISND